MEPELWYRWRMADSTPLPDRPRLPQPAPGERPSDLRRAVGVGLIRLGRAIAGPSTLPAAGQR
jgi:hypothetical protein